MQTPSAHPQASPGLEQSHVEAPSLTVGLWQSSPPQPPTAQSSSVAHASVVVNFAQREST
ncbi:hypothetical protein BE18_02465 [Sorangium cellulosum]|uniref:Uncharacterized protein n=1 Tax=Sorangium cellulosum TaxID=56 RepID=A0A150T636_SORCE|nr:hypothetical protein BE18_02465 [Sorangium cellulosum]